MIISCPECAGPFEVTDDRIAALVQVACPHCAFRMILDFAAANDPGLVEPGMRMASGFRSADDYHASLQDTAGAEQEAAEQEAAEQEAAATQAAEQEAAEQEAAEQEAAATQAAAERRAAERAAATRAAATQRAAEQRAQAAAARPSTPAVTPGVPPVRARPELATPPVRSRPARPDPSEEARTEVHMLPQGAERMVPVDIPPVRRTQVARDEDDIAVHVPQPATEIVRHVADEVSIDLDDEEVPEAVTTLDLPPVRRPPEPRPPRPEVAAPVESAAHPALGGDDDDDMPTMVVAPEARDATQRELLAVARRGRRPAEPEAEQAPSGRVPPHTPPGRAKVATRDEDESTSKPPKPAVTELAPFEEEEEVERMSTFGVVVVLLLVLLAGGLVGASIALNDGHNPDPRPLLEKLYRQIVKGQ